MTYRPNCGTRWCRIWCSSRWWKTPSATASAAALNRDASGSPPGATRTPWCSASPTTAPASPRIPAAPCRKGWDWESRAGAWNRSTGSNSLWWSAICRKAAWKRASSCLSGNRLYRRRMKHMPNFKVLIVDDERLSRRRVRRLLSLEPDCEVLGECANGMEAVASIQQARPDIVFLDVQMPEMDGFEVARAMADARPVVIFVSAYDEY